MLAVGVSEGVGGECQPCSGLLTVYVYTNPGPKTEGNFQHKENIILQFLFLKSIYSFTLPLLVMFYKGIVGLSLSRYLSISKGRRSTAV